MIRFKNKILYFLLPVVTLLLAGQVLLHPLYHCGKHEARAAGAFEAAGAVYTGVESSPDDGFCALCGAVSETCFGADEPVIPIAWEDSFSGDSGMHRSLKFTFTSSRAPPSFC